MNWLSILKAIAPNGKASILQATANAMPGIIAEFEINTALRQAHFLSQLSHESAGFKTTVEYASGADYEGRRDLGNTEPGDGKRFKGRGLIQLTGRSNYTVAGVAMGVDLVSNPEVAAQFPHAIRIAGWYWKTRKLNALADKDDISAITRKINGGMNGIDDRRRYLNRAKAALSRPDALPEAKPKTMTKSKTGGAAILAGTTGTITVVKEATDAAKAATESAASAWSIAASVGPWVLMAVVLIGAACFIWWDRREKMREHGI